MQTPPDAPQEGYLIPDDQFEELTELWHEFVATRQIPSLRTNQETALQQKFDELLGDDTGKHIELFNRWATTTLQSIIDSIRINPHFEPTFSGNLDDLAEHADAWDPLTDIQHLMELGFDRIQAKEKSPFDSPPFQKIDFTHPEWQRLSKVAINFVHSIMHLFNIENWQQTLEWIKDDPNEARKEGILENLPEHKRHFILFSHFLEGFLQQIQKIDIREEVSLQWALEGALFTTSQRYGLPTTGWWQIQEIDEIPTLQNGNPNHVMTAIHEIIKNAPRPAKINRQELLRSARESDPYVIIQTAVVSIQGQDHVVYKIMDRGTSIDYDAIGAKVGIPEWEMRDKTLGELMSYLSDRYTSVPLKGVNERKKGASYGLGLNYSRDILLAHNSDFFFANRPGGKGVSCMVIIPVEGKNAATPVSNMNLSGKDLQQIQDSFQSKGLLEPGETVLDYLYAPSAMGQFDDTAEHPLWGIHQIQDHTGGAISQTGLVLN